MGNKLEVPKNQLYFDIVKGLIIKKTKKIKIPFI